MWIPSAVGGCGVQTRHWAGQETKAASQSALGQRAGTPDTPQRLSRHRPDITPQCRDPALEVGDGSRHQNGHRPMRNPVFGLHPPFDARTRVTDPTCRTSRTVRVVLCRWHSRSHSLAPFSPEAIFVTAGYLAEALCTASDTRSCGESSSCPLISTQPPVLRLACPIRMICMPRPTQRTPLSATPSRQSEHDDAPA